MRRLIEAMREVRNLAGMRGAAAGHGSPRNRLIKELGTSIDALAAEITGEPVLLAAKPHRGRGTAWTA
jgi:hypothetical protein